MLKGYTVCIYTLEVFVTTTRNNQQEDVRETEDSASGCGRARKHPRPSEGMMTNDR